MFLNFKINKPDSQLVRKPEKNNVAVDIRMFLDFNLPIKQLNYKYF